MFASRQLRFGYTVRVASYLGLTLLIILLPPAHPARLVIGSLYLILLAVDIRDRYFSSLRTELGTALSFVIMVSVITLVGTSFLVVTTLSGLAVFITLFSPLLLLLKSRTAHVYPFKHALQKTTRSSLASNILFGLYV